MIPIRLRYQPLTSHSSLPPTDRERIKVWRVAVLPLVFLLASLNADGLNAQKLRDIIDQHFASDLPTSISSNDSEFLRRVSIDLTGMPPSAAEAASFIHSKAPAKREKLVNELLETPQFERYFATALDIALMERRPFKEIKQPQWDQYLLNSVRQNKPWNVLAREILSADGIDSSLRPAVRFALAREAEPNLLTRDAGRIFFGKDLQCAQCHDHPLVEDYLQSDYQGLLAFMTPGYIKTISQPGAKNKDGQPGKPVSLKILAEKQGNDISYESVFIKESKHRTGPRIIGEVALIEPDILPIENNPDSNNYSRRKQLAELSTNGLNRAFNENIANRLWAHLFGRGLVHPLDFHHRDNPAVKPELMTELGINIAKMQYNMKAFLRELALSRVYQRGFDLYDFSINDKLLAEKMIALQAEQKKMTEEIGRTREVYAKAKETWQAVEKEYISPAVEVENQRKSLATIDATFLKSKTDLDKLKLQVENLKSAALALQSAVKHIQNSKAPLADDKDLTQVAERLVKKMNLVQKDLQTLLGKVTKNEITVKDSAAKRETAKSNLKNGYAKRKPFLVNLSTAESKARKTRTELAKLVSHRTAIESKLATYERLRELARLNEKDQSANAKEISDDLLSQRERLLESLSIRLANNHTMAPLKPLSPEQLAWSVLKTCGVYDRTWATETTKLRKESKLDPNAQLNLDQQRMIEERTHTALKSHLNNFIRYYAAGAGQPQGDFFATADQALFAVNAGSINSYANPTGNNVTQSMIKSNKINEISDVLYLSILSRFPSEEEVEDLQEYLGNDTKLRRTRTIESVWSLLNSAEFRFNH